MKSSWKFALKLSSPVRIVVGILMLATGFGILFQNCSPAKFSNINPSGAAGLNSGSGTNGSSGLITKLTINNGALYTRLIDVSLAIASPGANEMYITQEPLCEKGGIWESFKGQRRWNLIKANSLNTVYVMTRDSNGLTSGCEQASITHDNKPPVLHFLLSPPAITNATRADFDFGPVDPEPVPLKYLCQVDKNSAYASCSPPYELTQLPEGPHDLSVKGIDEAGNESQPIVHHWVVDTTPPLLNWTQVPGQLTNQTQTKPLNSSRSRKRSATTPPACAQTSAQLVGP